MRPAADHRYRRLPLLAAVGLGPVAAAPFIAVLLLALTGGSLVGLPRLLGVFLLWAVPAALVVGGPVALWCLRDSRGSRLRWALAGAAAGIVASAVLLGWLFGISPLGDYIADRAVTGALLALLVIASAIASALCSHLIVTLIERRTPS